MERHGDHETIFSLIHKGRIVMPKYVTVKKLDWAERWLRDGLEISRLPATVKIVEIDMIGGSVATDSFFAPVLVIAEPDRKPVVALAL